MKHIAFLSLLLLFLTTCQSNRKLELATGSKESTHFKVGFQLSNLIKNHNQEYNFHLLTQGEGSQANLQKLLEGKSDFALIQNDITSKKDLSKVRTVIPLYPQILFIIYQPDIEANSLQELVKGRKIAVGPKTGGTAIFVEHLLQNYGIPSDSYELYYSSYSENTISDIIPISISLTSPNNTRISNMILEKNGKIWSLDNPEMLGNGTSVEGFCLMNPLAHPFIIPKNIFRQHPENPILTVAVYNLLVTSEKIDSDIVYSLVSTILENKEILSNKDVRFRFLDENLTHKSSFQFPLHEGTRNYLKRNEPSFFERYAELFGVLLTVGTIFLGAVSSLISIGRRRRKNLIDHYYLDVMEIENALAETKDSTKLEQYFIELKQLRQKAFQAVVKEKLGADDSFRIFIAFLSDVMREIRNQLETEE